MSQTTLQNLEPTSIRDEALASTPSIQRVSHHSLSGNIGQQSALHRSRTGSFVTAEYEHLNPEYDQPETLPVWGLAKPLPRVVRAGMRSRLHSTATMQYARQGSNASSTVNVPGLGTSREEARNHQQKVKFSEPATIPQPEVRSQSDMHDLPITASNYTTDAGVMIVKDRFPENQTNQRSRSMEQSYHNKWGQLRHKMRQPLTEFLGTFVALVLALSTSLAHASSGGTYGDALATNLAWGFGIMLGIYTCGGVSGGHLNPAVSIMLSIFRGFPWHHCYKYIVAQVLGAFAAAWVIYGLYRNSIIHSDGDLLRSSTGVAFYTRPQDWLSNVTAFFTEFVATGILAGVILALGDDSNAPPGAGMQAFIIGLLVFALCMGFSYNTGPALNPARDLGPRLVALAAGYGGEVLTERHAWWIWGCWVAPITGSLVGAFVYDMLVFTGGESPLNYPGSRWTELSKSITEKAAQRFRMKSKKVDDEKV